MDEFFKLLFKKAEPHIIKKISSENNIIITTDGVVSNYTKDEIEEILKLQFGEFYIENKNFITDFIDEQHDKIYDIVSTITSNTYSEYEQRFDLKISTTIDKIDTYRQELDWIQSQLLNFNEWALNTVANSFTKDYHSNFDNKVVGDFDDNTEVYEYFGDGWMKSFIKSFISNHNFLPWDSPFINFDYDNIKINKYEIADNYDISNIEKTIPIKGFQTLVDATKMFQFFLMIYIDYHEYKKNQNTKRIQQKTSYNWQGNTKVEIPRLYKKMVGKFIAADTSTEQFMAAFTSQPIGSFRPLEWISSTVLLAYFINLLRVEKKIRSYETDLWSVAEGCFKNTKRKTLSSAYINSLNNTNKNHPEKPKNHQTIDELFT